MSHPSETELRAFLAGELGPDDAGPIAAHLDACPGCQGLAERLTAVPRDLWASLVVASDLPAAETGPPAPAIPGYEGLRELGRGGSGVVYRAREVTTGRVVALKMLRVGVLASPAEQEWFLAEARAAANLRHRHIVTVLAVGEASGLPYYAMEYLPAGSLADRLDGTPLPPGEAAALVEAVARAIQLAHEKRVIHRDLKPGNILLDTPPGVAGLGVPKVSDFGMATHPDPGEAPTPTQAVLGTPSYMAPEQAFGRSREVGPAADVYALGAILHELLTGRPPFRGGTPYETLLQVRAQEPVAPRRLRRGLPKDLETVCLKCLEKDPRRRYPSAVALADDLQSFLAGRPIAARPVGWPGRLARWCRREPAVAILAGLSLALLVSGLVAVTVLWRRAEARGADARARAEEAARRQESAAEALRLYTQAANLLFRNPGLVTLEERDALVRALDLYERLLGEVAGDPEEEHRFAYATLQLADGLNNLGEHGPAARVCRRAVATLRRLSEAYPQREDYRFHHAEGCSQLGGTLVVVGGGDEAFGFRREAVRVGDELVARHPGRDDYRASLAAYQATLAREYAARGEPTAAELLFVRSLEANRELVARYPQDPVRYQFLDVASRTYAEFLLMRDRAGDRYWEFARERLELCDRARAQPNWAQIVPHLVHLDVACVLDRVGRRAEADRVMAHGLAVWGELAARQPPVAGSKTMYAYWLDGDGHRRWATDPAGARECFRQAIAVLEPLVSGPSGSGADLTFAEVLALCPDPSIRDPARALAHAQRVPAGFELRPQILGICFYEDGDDEAARSELEAFLADGRLPAGDHRVVLARVYLAMALGRLGERDRAEAELRAARGEIRTNPNARWQTLAALGRSEKLLAD